MAVLDVKLTVMNPMQESCLDSQILEAGTIEDFGCFACLQRLLSWQQNIFLVDSLRMHCFVIFLSARLALFNKNKIVSVKVV